MTKQTARLLDEAIAAIRSAAGGKHDEEAGAERLGTNPETSGPLHKLFRPITATWRKQGEDRLGRSIPDAYLEWLERSNGGWFYGGTLSFAGVRPDTTDIEHPFDLDDANVHERPAGATDDMFFFGFYDEDASRLYVDDGGEVHRAARDSVEPLNTWPSVAHAIHAETTRLVELFGDGFDESVRSLPE